MFNRYILINSMLFNAAWFGCVLLGDKFAAVVLIWAVIHLFYRRLFKTELLTLFIITLLGIAVDTTLMHLGILMFDSDSYIIPFWLMMIWLAFAMTINGCLKPLQNNMTLQYLVGAIFPPLSYMAGASLGAVSFGFVQSYTLFTFSILWCVLLPIFFYINKKIQQEVHHV